MSMKAEMLGALSLAANVLFAAVKILVGIAGSSFALIADGIESLADCFSSLIVWNGLRVAGKAADAEHPYGHGKAEAIAALIAGLLLFGSGIFIAVEAVQEIRRPQGEPQWFTAPALLAIVLAKEALHRFYKRAADRFNSVALSAEAVHHRSDVLTSLGVLSGVVVALSFGPEMAFADGVAALFVTGLIFRNAWRIMRPAIDELMDRRITGSSHEEIRLCIKATEGVEQIETLWVRRSGSGLQVDVHIEVAGDLTVDEGHRIAHRVKDALLDLENPQVLHVSTHVEPHRPDQTPQRRPESPGK
jgi:cation diffusion facilitator family transporter